MHDCVSESKAASDTYPMTDTLGKRVKWARENRPGGKASQEELGKAAGGLSRSAISQWEKDLTIPASTNLIPAAQFLGVNPDWLVTGVGSQERSDAFASPLSTVSAFGLNPAKLRDVVTETEKFLAHHHLVVPPEKKADLYFLLYEKIEAEGRKADAEIDILQFENVIRLAV